MAKFEDPGRTNTGSLTEINAWALTWDTYDSRLHDEHPMPALYPGARHVNWWGSGLTLDELLSLAQVHGIPVAWVPSQDILRSLVDADNSHEAKLAVLAAEDERILAQCRGVLAECTDEWLSGEVAAGLKALSAYADGHHEAAACLAIAALEQILYTVNEIPPGKRKHGTLAKIGAAEPARLLPARQYVRAPLATLYTPYWPESGDALPVNLSRHAVLHHVPLDHLSQGHCIIAVMLLTSVIRQSQERVEDIRWDLLVQASD
ncbi:hypothetical protein ABZY57_04560 [Streptomyces sp. NPDC006450]|uniref:hypothetical protein n=1 Tax=Streptomyces sp. NPDC006450 TaxID=3155458 RepID=UPI0033BCA62D